VYTAISVKVVHEQSRKVEYERERLLGISNKLMNFQTIPSSLSRSYGTHTRKNAQVVTNLQQTCTNAVPTTCQQDVFALLVPSLSTTCYKVVELNASTSLLQVVPTTCYIVHPAIQQFVNKL
jgi:hypothetical protein